MIRLVARWTILLCCALVVAQGVLLWDATGRAGYTRFKDTDRAAREASAPSAADLFADTGLTDGGDVRVAEVPNGFALGLLPSTYPWRVWDPHLASLVTIAAPALLISVLTLLLTRARKPVASQDAASSS
ncbi:MAG: hypothetical protein AB7G17_09685 [Phycisphaerales bacterium]